MYQSIAIKNVTQNNGPQRVAVFSSTELLVRLITINSFVSGYQIERSFNTGTCFRVRWVQGNLYGQLIPLEYGEHEILFDVPNVLGAYELEIIPSRLTFSYTIEVFKQVYNPRFDALAEKLGINVNLLQNIPQQTLLILEGLNLMASSDTRQLISTLEAQSIVQAQTQALANAVSLQAAATEAALVSVTEEMVSQEEYELIPSSFILQNGFMVASVSHGLSGGKVQMSLTDSVGDEQGFSQLIATSPSMAKVELSLQQHMDNTYPLTFLLQGRKTPVVASSWVDQPISDQFYRVLDGLLDRSSDGLTVENPALVSDVVAAFFGVGSQFVFIKKIGGATGYIDNGNLGLGFIPCSIVDYDAADNTDGRVTILAMNAN